MKWERWHVVVAGALLVGASIVGFKQCGRSPDAPDGRALTDAVVPAPPDLLCDVYVATPNASWNKLQRGIGGAVGILPSTLPGVVVALTDLDIQLANELDGTSPLYAAVAGDPWNPSMVVAMKVVDARRARAALVEGEAARYTASVDAGMTWFAPKRASDRRFEIAMTSNGYLLAARQAADLGYLGPYVSRTLPSRPLPSSPAMVVEVPRKAIARALVPEVTTLWKNGKAFLLAEDERMRSARHRPPDFGDPAAIVAALDGVIGRRIDVLRDLERVRLTVDVTDDAAIVEATLTPAAAQEGAMARAWIEGMRLGDASPALALPASSALAASFRDGEEARAEQGKSLETALASALGPRLKDPAKLHAFVDAATRARGESFAIAVGVGVDEPLGLFLRAQVRDPGAAGAAVHAVLDLVRESPFKEMLRVRDVTAHPPEELGDVGKVEVATLVREAARGASPDAGAPPKASRGESLGSVGLAWSVRDGVLVASAGAEPLVTLKGAAKTDRRLADEPSLKRFVGGLGSDASTVLVLQPLRLDPKRAALPTAPVALAVGRHGADAFVKADVSDLLLREATRWAMGF